MSKARRSSTDAPPELDDGATQLLALVRRRGALTRSEMTEATGWARVTVTSRLEKLLATGLLVPAEAVSNGRGRPATRYRLDASRAMLLVADVGALGMRLARVDLEGHLEEANSVAVDIAVGPDELLALIRKGFDELTASSADRPVWGIGISLPGPVDHAAGRVISPPIMTGWHQFPIRETLQDWYACPVLVENDVNAMAVGELVTLPSPTSELLVVKVGTGIGCGIVSAGHVLRGAAGAAGDIGHTAADTTGVSAGDVDCRCGKRGCVEAYAGGWALARSLAEDQGHAVSVNDVVDLLDRGDSNASRMVNDAGLILGASLATAVSLLNPSAVVLSGQVAVAAGDHLLSSVRERIYARALPLATRNLDIRVSSLWPDSGVHGLAHEVGELVLSGG
jgi:predicted NBD/HSP70 family sugar kinase